MLEVFMILMLAGTGIHLTTAIKSEDESSNVKYSGPVVYSNLPPPVLYFPNFPEKPEISSRGDAEEKKIEYIPFPYKDLPLLVYQSDSQPPVHVVEKNQNHNSMKSNSSSGNSYDVKMHQQSGPAVYQTSGHMQNSRQQYRNPQPQAQMNSKTHSTAGVAAVTDQFPDFENQQYISIGLSTLHQELPNNGYYNMPQPVSQTNPSSLSQKQNTVSYQVQSNMKQNSQQQMPYAVVQNTNQNSAKAPMQYAIPTMGQQQPPKIQNSMYQNVNQQYSENPTAMQHSQQNVGNQYQSNSQVQSQMQNMHVPQQQYNIQQIPGQKPQPQNQYAQMFRQKPTLSNQVQSSTAYPAQQNNNYQQTSPTPMQQIMYQTTPNSNVNSIQHLGISISSVAQPQSVADNQYNNNQQVSVSKYMPQNMPKPQQTQQAKANYENESDEDDKDQQYLSIVLYPYDTHGQEPQQIYKIPLPPQNFQYQQVNSNEPKQMKENPSNSNSVGIQKQQVPQMNVQGQGYQYINIGSSSANRKNPDQQKNIQMDPRKQTTYNKMNAKDNNSQKQSTKQESDENADSEDVEYQQILIHIPHTLGGRQPQVLVQQGDADQSKTPYTGTAQIAGLMDGTNKQLNAAMSNIGQNPNYYLENGKQKTKGMQMPVSFSGALNSNPFRHRFPVETYSGSETIMYPNRLTQNPFRQTPVLSYGGQLPRMYASSNLRYTSVDPFFMNPRSFRKNAYRSPHAVPFDQIRAASIMKPNFLQRPFHSAFHTSLQDEMLAEASFQSPTFVPSPRGRMNITDVNGNEDLYGEFEDVFTHYDTSAAPDAGKSVSDESMEKFFHKITRDMVKQDAFGGIYPGSIVVKPGQNAMPALNPPYLPHPHKVNYPGPAIIQAGQTYNVPLFPLSHPSIQGNRNVVPYSGKYGSFVKKLTALSNIILSQSLGMKSKITPREETKLVDSMKDEYSVEEINDPELPENSSPRLTAIKSDQNLDGVSIPLNPNRELSRRISKLQEDSPKPPIIVYKGPKPPVEVYGTKDDIEKVKDPRKTSDDQVSVDRNDPEQESGLDYIKMMYSILPDFIKHSISNRNDDEEFESLGSTGWQLVNQSHDKPVDDVEDHIATDDQTEKDKQIPKDPIQSTKSDHKSPSAFKEDVEELVKLLHKEEKSDIFPL